MSSQKEVKPLLLCLMDLNNRFTPTAKSEEICIKHVFQVNVIRYVYEMYLFIRPETLLVANVFLAHSHFEISMYLKYKENCFCEACKWFMKSFFC
jgi:hypothetical protein